MRNGPLTETDGKVSARLATPNRETAARGEKGASSECKMREHS